MTVKAISKNKGEGRGRYTYKYKIYYQDVLVSDNGQSVNFATDDPGTNYFTPNDLVTRPFLIAAGDYEFLYPETYETTDTSKLKQHTVQLQGFYKKAGQYKVEFVAESKPLDGVNWAAGNADQEVITTNNVATKEVTVAATQ